MTTSTMANINCEFNVNEIGGRGLGTVYIYVCFKHHIMNNVLTALDDSYISYPACST